MRKWILKWILGIVECPNCDRYTDKKKFDKRIRGITLCRNCYNNSRRHFKMQNPVSKQKIRARQKAREAVKKGKIIKKPCVVCGETKVEAHHLDYDRPLQVLWMCEKHHDELHGHNPPKGK